MNCSNCKIANQNVPCIPLGNDFKLAIVLKEKIKADGEVSERDINILNNQVSVAVIKPNGDAVDNTQNVYSSALNGSTVIITFDKQGENESGLPKGKYGIKVTGKRTEDSSDFCFSLPPGLAFEIVADSSHGYFPSDSIITYTVNGVVGVAQNVSSGGGGGEQVQADWNESNTSSKAYIKNKPTIYTKPQTGIPSSDLTSGVQASLGKADSAMQRFVVVISYANNTYSSNKTYAQLVTAHENGDEVIATYNDFIYRLSNVSNSSVTFEMQNAANGTFSTIDIANDDAVSKSDAIIPDVTGKENKLAIVTPTITNNALTLAVGDLGKFFKLGTLSAVTTITLPNMANENVTHVIGCMFDATIDTGGDLKFSATQDVYEIGLSNIEAGKRYEVSAIYVTEWRITVTELTLQQTS